MSKEVGEMLAARREELGLTQDDVATGAGLSRGRIAQFEGGASIPQKHHAKLAKIYKIPESALEGQVRYVRKEAELRDWLRRLFDDHVTHGVIRASLVWVGQFMLEEELLRRGVYRYSGSIERIAASTPGVELFELEEQWDALLESGYVFQVGDSEWALDLTFPPER